MRYYFKRALSTLLAICILLASATCLMGVPVFAATTTTITEGQMTYNLAFSLLDGLTSAEKNAKVLASATAQGKVGYMAFDGINTADNRWYPGAINTSNPEQYVMIDLGAEYIVTGLKLNFRNDVNRRLDYGVYAATTIGGLDYTADNKAAINDYLVTYGANIKTGTAAYAKDFTGNLAMTAPTKYIRARYVMVNMTRQYDGDMCLFECEIFGYKFSSDKYTVDHANKTITLTTPWQQTGVTAGELAESLDFAGNATLEISKGTDEVLADGDTLTVKHVINSNISDIANKAIADTVYTIQYTPTSYNVAYNVLAGLSDNERYATVFESNAGNGANAPYSKGHNGFDGAIDGSNNSGQWYPGAGYPQWLLLDLGAVYKLTGIKALWRANEQRTYTYDMYALNDLADVDYTGTWSRENKDTIANAIISNGANYKILSQQTAKMYKTHTLTAEPQGRYILIHVTNSPNGDINFAEMEIYGYTPLTSSSADVKIDSANKTISLPSNWEGKTVADLKAVIGGVKGNAYLTMSKTDDAGLASGDVVTVNHAASTLLTASAGLPFAATTNYTINIASSNLALNKPVIANKANTNYGPEKVVNGYYQDSATGTASQKRQWMTDGTGNSASAVRPWIIIDLGASYNVASLKPFFDPGAAYAFDVYVVEEIAAEWSADNVQTIGDAILATTPVLSDTSQTLGGPSVDLSAKGRYVLVKFNQRSTGNNTLSLYELEIYGYNIDSKESIIDNATSTITIPYSWGSEVTADKLLSDVTVSGAAYATVNMAGDYLANGDTLVVNYTKGSTVGTKNYTILMPNTSSVAIGKNSLACDLTANNYGPSYAFNGDTAGRQWMSNGALNGTAWIIVDLGANYNLTSATTYLGKGDDNKRTYYYNIYVADKFDFEGEFTEENKEKIFEGIKLNGTLAAQVNSSNVVVGGGTTAMNTVGQYVLLHITNCNASNTVSVQEFELFGYALTSTEATISEFDKTISLPLVWGEKVTVNKLLSDVKIAGNAYITVESDDDYITEGDKVLVHYYTGATIEYKIIGGVPDGSQVNIFKPTTVGDLINFYNSDEELVSLSNAEGNKVYFSFEYYTDATNAYQPGVTDTDDGVDSAEGMYLPAGRNKFEQTYTISANGGNLVPFIKNVAATTESFYVWNVVVKLNDVDVPLAYANSSTTKVTYLEVEYVADMLKIHPDNYDFLTRVDLSDVKPDDITNNTYLGLLNSTAYIPTADQIKVYSDYYISGYTEGLYIFHSDGTTAGTNGNMQGVSGSLKIGDKGTINTWKYFDHTGNIAIYTAIEVKNDTKYIPDYVYLWNQKIETKAHGTVTFIEQGSLAQGKSLTSNVNITLPVSEITYGNDVITAIANDKVYTLGDTNDDEKIDVCDLVYMANAESKFKDVRTFGKGLYNTDTYQMAVVRNKIWESAFNGASLGSLISNNIEFTSSEKLYLRATEQTLNDVRFYVGQGAGTDGEYAYFTVSTANAEVGTKGFLIRKYRMSDGAHVATTTTPIIGVGKANDLTYNPNLQIVGKEEKGCLVAIYNSAHPLQVAFIDPDTLQLATVVLPSGQVVEGSMDMTDTNGLLENFKGGSAITYNEKRNCYAIGSHLYILDANFNLQKLNTRDRNLDGSAGYTNQGMCSDDSYIYFNMSPPGEGVPFAERDNLIVVYDWDGNYVTTITINDNNESESLFFVDGDLYISYNVFSGAALQKVTFTVDYDKTFSTSTKAEGSDLRIMSYNILAQKYGGVTSASRAGRLKDIINTYAPDVIGIQ